MDPVNDEAHAAVAPALDLLVQHRDDAGLVDADVLPRRLRHVEVGAPRAAPAAVGQRVHYKKSFNP